MAFDDDSVKFEKLDYDTEADLDAEVSSSGVIHDELGDHPGPGRIAAGYDIGLLTRGLVAYYPLDDSSTASTAVDKTELGNDGTINGATYVGSGQVGSDSLSFDGIDDYVNTGYQTNIASGEFSVSYWINLDSTPSGDRDFLGNFDGTTGFITGYTGASNSIRFWIDGNDIEGSDTGTSYTHLAFVRRSDGVYEIWIDGALDTSGTNTGDADSTETVQYGRRPGGDNHTGGNFDDVRLYDRALNSIEIEALANRTETSPVPTDSTL